MKFEACVIVIEEHGEDTSINDIIACVTEALHLVTITNIKAKDVQNSETAEAYFDNVASYQVNFFGEISIKDSYWNGDVTMGPKEINTAADEEWFNAHWDSEKTRSWVSYYILDRLTEDVLECNGFRLKIKEIS